MVPVLGDLGQAEAAAQIDQVENIFLEAAAAEADACAQKVGPDAAVDAGGVRDFVDVGAGRLADRRNGVDRGDALGEQRIRRELRQLAAPEARANDALLRHPVLVHLAEQLCGAVALRRVEAADQHAVGLEQVLQRGAF